MVNLASYPRVVIDGATPYGSRWGGGNIATGLANSSNVVESTTKSNSDYISPLKLKINQFSSITDTSGSGTYFGSWFNSHQSRNQDMPVCSGVQSFIMATRAPIFHACSVDLSWQTTVHACQRCPRAAMSPSAATAAIATQSNVEGTNSRFCPAGVHMGKCLPAQDVYTDAWGTPSVSAVSGGLISRMSQKFSSSKANTPDISIPPPSTIEPWVPPDLPLPTTVHSKASFLPTIPIAVQSPLPDESASKPNNGASVKPCRTTPLKNSEEKEFRHNLEGSTEIIVSADRNSGRISEVDKFSNSELKSPPTEMAQKEDAIVLKSVNQSDLKDTKEVSY